MAEDNDLYCEQHLIGPMDPSLSMVVIRESTIFAKDDRVVFPPINHENLHVGFSSVLGVDTFLEFPSESESPSSSSRRSASSSSFSLSPSDSDGQSPLTACEFDRKSPSPPSETEGKSPPSLGGEFPPSDSNGQPPLLACEFDRKPPWQPSETEGKSPRSPSGLSGESPPCDSDGKSPWNPLYRETDDILQDWWELFLVRVYSKLKSLVTWFSTTLRSIHPVLAIAIWWWMRVRAHRKRVEGETTDRLRETIKEKDERIVKLLHQIAQMNELPVKHHKEIVSRR